MTDAPNPDTLTAALTAIADALGPVLYSWPTDSPSMAAISAENDPESTTILVRAVGDEVRVYPCHGVDGCQAVRAGDPPLAIWTATAGPSEAEIQALMDWLWGGAWFGAQAEGVIPEDLVD